MLKLDFKINLILVLSLSVALSSCGYLFYNYRAYLLVNYVLIENKKNVYQYKKPSMIILENVAKANFDIIYCNEKKRFDSPLWPRLPRSEN